MKNLLLIGFLNLLLMAACNSGSASSSGSGGSSGSLAITNLESTVVLGNGCTASSSQNFICSAANSSMTINNISYTSSPASYLFIPMAPKGVTIIESGNCQSEPVTNYGSCSLSFTAESATVNSALYIPLTNSPLTPTLSQLFISIIFQ